MRSKLRQFETLLILIPIVVASVQLYFSNVSDLTRWKGGGFGMYTDPHPTLHRKVWLQGKIDTSLVSVRIHRFDERLHFNCMRDTPLRRALEGLEGTASDRRNFPSGYDVSPLHTELHRFLQEYGDEPEIAALFPRTDISMKVVEVAISPDYKTLAAKTISERKLCPQ